eukprot:GHUV01005252.1.p1 GENE.GHUV01005252.1~~GHUV01005252.1.p1  ORF type:complete len:196 (+),score=50.58 GHUV01005252.1:1436-2023(+)
MIVSKFPHVQMQQYAILHKLPTALKPNVVICRHVTCHHVEHNRPTHIAGADSISLKKIIDMFYEKVVADPKIGHFFVGIDMIKLKRHQVRTMALAFGGKELVNDEDPNMDLRKIHIHLIRDKKLDLSDWECFVGLFDETLEQLEREIPAETRQKAMRSLRATRHYFVPIGQETEYTTAPLIQVPEAADAGEALQS